MKQARSYFRAIALFFFMLVLVQISVFYLAEDTVLGALVGGPVQENQTNIEDNKEK